MPEEPRTVEKPLDNWGALHQIALRATVVFVIVNIFRLSMLIDALAVRPRGLETQDYFAWITGGLNLLGDGLRDLLDPRFRGGIEGAGYHRRTYRLEENDGPIGHQRQYRNDGSPRHRGPGGCGEGWQDRVTSFSHYTACYCTWHCPRRCSYPCP